MFPIHPTEIKIFYKTDLAEAAAESKSQHEKKTMQFSPHLSKPSGTLHVHSVVTVNR